MTTSIRYPANPITPHGAYYFLNGILPIIKLKSFDKSVTFELMGGGAIPDRVNAPESAILAKGVKGAFGNWKFIDQQGANEDGVTFLDSVNEAIEVDLPVRVTARDGKTLRKVVRHLLDSLDPKKTSELSVFTQELGKWWGEVRWRGAPLEDQDFGAKRRTAELTLRLRIDSGAWRSHDHVDVFRFAFQQMTDSFTTDYTEAKNLGPQWPLYLTGPGGGYVYASHGSARWRDDPMRKFFTEGRDFVAGPYIDPTTGLTFETETDDQVVEIQFDTFQELGAANDIWLRKGHTPDGKWNGYGTRVRISGSVVTVSAFVNYHETVLKRGVTSLGIPPLLNEKWRGEAGGLDADGNWNHRIFKVKRGNGSTVMTVKDSNNVTPLGAAFRGIGFGGHAAGALFTQGTPAAVRYVSAGDASATEQSGYLTRINLGSLPYWDRYTLFGPGTFEIAAGPGMTDMVKFGPLLPNQVVQLRTDGRQRAVVDLTSVPPTPNELAEYRKVLAELESYAPIANIGPTLEANASMFGVVPPQGNMHRLLDGRFVQPIPAKSPGRNTETFHVACSIKGGNADSRIVAAGTPLRRSPI